MKRWALTLIFLAATVAAQDKNSSVTVDLLLAGRNVPQVTEAFAMFLERGGMDNLELAKPGAPLQTDYKLFAEFLGEPTTGVTEIRATLTDRAGKTVWDTRATAADDDWKKAGVREPGAAMCLLTDRLRPVFKTEESCGEKGHEGKFARLMQERSGLPPDSERKAMSPRLEAFKGAGNSASLAVYAVNAPKLAELISAAGVAKASAAADPAIHVAPNMNEQKMLWDAARAFREYLRKNPPSSDYAVFADYIGDGAGAVHFIVADRTGQWVIVDFQNDHHSDFQAIAPKTPDDGARLVAKRLQGYLR
jgi:hypothetical protein